MVHGELMLTELNSDGETPGQNILRPQPAHAAVAAVADRR